MKSKNGTFEYKKRIGDIAIIVNDTFGSFTIGSLRESYLHFNKEVAHSTPFTSNDLRELADFIEELQKHIP